MINHSPTSCEAIYKLARDNGQTGLQSERLFISCDWRRGVAITGHAAESTWTWAVHQSVNTSEYTIKQWNKNALQQIHKTLVRADDADSTSISGTSHYINSQKLVC